ncbi:MAG TPA: BON domain-containing protein [Verrucomicrobiae bacterium]|nr:BON domain-containing protein [Verrucomicrobiae bacterium]
MRILRQLFILLFLTLLAGCTYHRAPEPYASPAAYNGQVISSAPYPSTPAAGTLYTGTVTTNTAGTVSSAGGLDDTVALRVQQKLQGSEIAGLAPNINVSSRSGTVTLTGFVPTQQERQLAETLARSTAGVLDVENDLQVVGAPTGRTAPYPGTSFPPSPPNSEAAGELFNLHVQGLNETDRALAQRVLDGLRTNSALMAIFPSVDIEITGGRVVLQGQVQTEQQRQTIESAVRQAAGVNAVEDRLQVLGVPASNP